MQTQLDDLRIPHSELEEITGLDISDTFMGHAVRPSALRTLKRLAVLLITEFIALLLIIIFCLPASLVIGRNIPGFTGDASSTAQFLQITLSISFAAFALWNAYIFTSSRRFKLLANLLDDVDKHNEIIDAVNVMNELGTAQQMQEPLHEYPLISAQHRDELRQALEATRSSLISALKTEKILRKHQKFVNRRYELFTEIETNLAVLQTLNRNQDASQYRELLGGALEIGISVRREIEQLKDP